MNRNIKNLEKAKSKILRIRACIVRSCNKESGLFDERIARADKILTRITASLKFEYSNLYTKR